MAVPGHSPTGVLGERGTETGRSRQFLYETTRHPRACLDQLGAKRAANTNHAVPTALHTNSVTCALDRKTSTHARTTHQSDRTTQSKKLTPANPGHQT